MKTEPKPMDLLDKVSIALGIATAIAAILRIFGSDHMFERLDGTTLTYFAVAGALLLLRNVKSLSFGDYKLELKDIQETANEALEEAKTASSMARQSSEAINQNEDAAQSEMERGMQPAAASGLENLDARPDVWDRVPGGTLDDPWKGQFGEQRERNHRRLSAEVTPVAGDEGWFRLRLWVNSTDEINHPLQDRVRFFVHPTFGVTKPFVDIVAGKAEIRLKAWGAFTVGALADEGKTELEYDLELDSAFPKRFRER